MCLSSQPQPESHPTLYTGSNISFRNAVRSNHYRENTALCAIFYVTFFIWKPDLCDLFHENHTWQNA